MHCTDQIQNTWIYWKEKRLYPINLNHHGLKTKIFVNLPIMDLNKSVVFFTKLGFSFNPQFTDENATCMIIGEDIFIMLLVEKFFKTFTKKDVCDTSKNTEAIVALSVESREKVDQMIEKAIEAGGSEPREKQDHGWMYGRSFEDIDGHLWEVFFMEESAIKK
jgi:predicted lactoylglutathione lyase